METTYLSVADDLSIHAEVIDAATTEVTLTTRFRQQVVLTMPTPRDGQRFAVDLSAAIYQAEKRGAAALAEDPRKLDDDFELEDAF